ncbi:type III secretion protein [Pseudomonas sp. MWU13-3659]|uniref:type III secretion protein n=1 Tax=Pseudomonas sp. MWU13-3659 TaxID=2986964 RepID=UPI002074FFE0|nr:type III secretion protein [Pseudomonas sp. MWU13-3659]
MPLSTLVRIKRLRLQQAERETLRQQARLQAAQTAKDQAITAHHDYHAWRLDEERRLFDEHQGQMTQRRVLERWRHEVSLLREREAQLQEQVVEKEQALRRQREALETARKAFAKAQQQLDKFLQLQVRALKEANQLQELKEELEMDEHHRRDAETA